MMRHTLTSDPRPCRALVLSVSSDASGSWPSSSSSSALQNTRYKYNVKYKVYRCLELYNAIILYSLFSLNNTKTTERHFFKFFFLGGDKGDNNLTKFNWFILGFLFKIGYRSINYIKAEITILYSISGFEFWEHFADSVTS